MISKIYVIGLLFASVCVASVASMALAPAPSTLLPEEDVTLQKIKTFFEAALLKAEFDKDGDLMIEDGGFTSYVKVDQDRKLITFLCAFHLKESASEIKKLRLVNSMNDDLIFVRFCMPVATTLWCDYQLLYGGGITPYAIVNNYRLFATVTKGAVASMDPEDIIGSD